MISVCIATQVNWQDRPTFSLLKRCLASLEQLPDYEVIICGNIRDLPFDHKAQIIFRSNEKLGAKNNLLIKEAKGQHVVYMRDYMTLAPGWYKGYQDFGGDWDLCMNKIQNPDGSRYRDWCVWDHPDFGYEWTQYDKPWPNGIKRKGRPGLVSYNFSDTSGHYISGGYFVGKTKFLQDNPFDGDLDFGECEDIEFCDTVKHKWIYKMNTNSVTNLQIQKDVILPTYE